MIPQSRPHSLLKNSSGTRCLYLFSYWLKNVDKDNIEYELRLTIKSRCVGVYIFLLNLYIYRLFL